MAFLAFGSFGIHKYDYLKKVNDGMILNETKEHVCPEDYRAGCTCKVCLASDPKRSPYFSKIPPEFAPNKPPRIDCPPYYEQSKANTNVDETLRLTRARTDIPVMWTTKSYDPLEPRTMFSPSKPIITLKPLHEIPRELVLRNVDLRPWMSAPPNHPRQYFRDVTNPEPQYPTAVFDRCQEWSTLRQMLPSKGYVSHKERPQCWGEAPCFPPILRTDIPKSFPAVHSPMTKFVEEMSRTNKLLQLF